MLGLHKSPYHGFSIEFSQHRPYIPGDSLKDVDWKIYGKTDRYFIKQYEEETNLKAHILLDTSASMRYASPGRVSKLEYAKVLASVIAFMLIKQNDAAGLYLYSDKIEKILPPKASRIYLDEIMKALAASGGEGKSDATRALGEVVEKINRRGMIIVISDLFEDVNEVIETIKRLTVTKSKVVVFQILDPLERSFDFGNDAIFKDMETGAELSTQPRQIVAAYRDAFEGFVSKIKAACLNSGIDFNQVDTAQPYDVPISAFLRKRG
ncbi:MAG: DUF58 domain-containing protein [Ignavibacteriaceae bacterium]|nr:MAG: DUF58 domain-containing protein [Ignavibacteriaceae bacterium]MBV6444036.1 hypothetical protein [Ignavibacteriaceae bacterium]MBW7874057.1 DUF58 domain-containing protein [Ignavibacteria bacterium]MBZ0196112.1 DUF58 domain-containing protein [Ignavibacteriaceae bacterium]OQY74027.1 MAG: DUF58 domain-containing protein [Ignavibacteriales bacterium UTCHB3]